MTKSSEVGKLEENNSFCGQGQFADSYLSIFGVMKKKERKTHKVVLPAIGNAFL
jgi:hypothetical protein